LMRRLTLGFPAKTRQFFVFVAAKTIFPRSAAQRRRDVKLGQGPQPRGIKIPAESSLHVLCRTDGRPGAKGGCRLRFFAFSVFCPTRFYGPSGALATLLRVNFAARVLCHPIGHASFL